MYDIWENRNEVPEGDNEWISDTLKTNRKTQFRKIKKPSEIEAIETPHPAWSYNPSFQDYVDACKEKLEAIMKEQKAERKIEKEVAKWRKAVPADIEEMDQLAQLMLIKKEEEEDEDDKDDVKETFVLSQKTKLKTAKAKRNEREEKQRVRLAKEIKERKKQENKIYEIKSISKEIDKAKERNASLKARKNARKVEHEKYGTKTLSKHQFKDVETQIALSGQLPDSLRGLRTTEQNLLKERFVSFQKRNILEPRIKSRCKRKYKLKKIPRAKMEWETTGMWKDEKLS